MKVYFISGLGADHRIFSHMRLPAGFEKVDLRWIAPLPKESLHDYALRLSEGIDTSEKFALVGLSMGGMIASVIAEKLKPAATILISSIATSDQLPRKYKLMYALRLQKLLPVTVIKSVSILKRIFTVETKEDKTLLRQIIRDTDPAFVRWALTAIPQWEHHVTPASLWQVHGDKDGILPIKNTRPTHTITNGSHMMVMTKAPEVNSIISEALSSIR